VLTRAELPDISQPLEILSDDIAAPKPAAASRPAASARPAPKSATPDAHAQAAGRASARKVFEAKFKEPNPRLPFYIAMGVLGLFAVGTIGYFWYQLRPAPSLVNASPRASTGERAVAAPAPSQLSPAAAPSSGPSAAQAIPGLPSAPVGPAAQPSVPIAVAEPVPAVRGPSPTPAIPRQSAISPAERVARSQATARAPQPAQQRIARAAEPAAPAVTPSRPTPEINPKVASGYAAFTAGDLPRARTEYEDALREEPANRDALLGLAAIEVRSGLYEAAESRYLRLLRADPRDANAQAGLIALRGARMDPQVAESRVKTLLATDPQAHVLHFTLGNQFAQQARWAEAQQEYFKAYAAEPENSDFAYNLAVSLDHLRQPKLAREYYQRAVAIAATRGGSFDVVSARARIAQLGN
jgi:Tfp pilus assembly protein PilF